MKVLVFFLCFLSVWLNASPLTIGELITNLTFNDQHGRTHRIEPSVSKFIVVFDKEQSSLLHRYLMRQPKGYLTIHQTALIADISQMPGFIAESFALPKMREYNYDVWLIRDEELSLRFPFQEQRITLIQTDGQKITDLEFATDIESVENFIKR